jgi:hypothetical protein
MTTFVRPALSILACFLLGTSAASAQATRTWVSGVGDDANPCSRTAPCKTFAGAISKTADGGEIDVIDSGAYGAVTITKDITISGEAHMAGVLAAGTNGITVSGAGIVVTLRHLNINGAGKTASPGGTGIRLLNGAALIVDDCVVSSFQTGIRVDAGQAFVKDSLITTNSVVGGTAVAGTLTFENTTFVDNELAVLPGGAGTIRLSNNSFYNNRGAFGCGGVLMSAGNNRKAGNSGGAAAVCAPNATMTVQ